MKHTWSQDKHIYLVNKDIAMTTLPQQETIVQYVTSSSQTQYTFAFYAPFPTDIQVFYQASTAVPIPSADILTLNVGYTVTYNSDPTTGGYITVLFTPITGYYLTINRQVQASLSTNFANASTFNGANLDAALDRLLLLIQQNLNYILQRNLSYVINSYLPNSMPFTQLPILANQQIWMGSASGVIAATLEQNPDVSTLRSELANQSPGTDGARLVGYYDTILNNPTTVDAILTALNTTLTTLNNSAFRIIGKQVLTGSGVYTPTSGTKYCWARGIAGGGGGAGATSGSGTQGIGGGGGAGAYGECWFAATTESYSCGTAGAGGAAGLAGSNGGSTTFGSLLNLGGGSGGQPNNTVSGQGFAVAGTGGTVNTADFGTNGNSGMVGFLGSSTGGMSGQGGNSQFGGGGVAVAGTVSQNGNAGTGYGAGGSGALAIGAVNVTGGPGTAAGIVVFEFG
jgi:hypothetical protein